MNQQIKILVVDDNQDLAVGIRDILMTNGFAASMAFAFVARRASRPSGR